MKMRVFIQKRIRKIPDEELKKGIMSYPSYRYYRSFLTGRFDYKENNIPKQYINRV